MTLAALHVTKCRLCGQPQAGPEGLCSDCSRALTRARQGSAALRSGAIASPRKARPNVSRIVLTSPVDSETPRPRARGRAVLWAALGMVAVIVVLGATAGLSPPRAVETKVPERAPRAVSPLVDPVTESVPAEAESVPLPQHIPVVAAEPPSQPKEPKRATVTRPPRTAAGASSGVDARSAGDVPATSGPTPQIEPPMQQARTNIVPGTASGDDEQALTRALEKCSEEKFLAGVICEQKARLRYCEGKWGQVPQCTAKPRVD